MSKLSQERADALTSHFELLGGVKDAVDAAVLAVTENGEEPTVALCEQIEMALRVGDEWERAGRAFIADAAAQASDEDERNWVASASPDFADWYDQWAVWRAGILPVLDAARLAIAERRRLMKARKRKPPPPPVEPETRPDHRCVCGKDGYTQDDDGRWFCKRHAYGRGLLTPPPEPDDEEE